MGFILAIGIGIWHSIIEHYAVFDKSRSVHKKVPQSTHLFGIIHFGNIYTRTFGFSLDSIANQDLRRLIQILHSLGGEENEKLG